MQCQKRKVEINIMKLKLREKGLFERKKNIFKFLNIFMFYPENVWAIMNF